MEKKESIKALLDFCNQTPIKPNEINNFLESIGTSPLHGTSKISDLVGRPQVSLTQLAEHITTLKEMLNKPRNRKEEIAEATEIKIKYKGYIEREKLMAEKMHRLRDIKIKGRFQYSELHELSTEARQKLERIDPETLAQASRIPGISPSDINVLLVLLGR